MQLAKLHAVARRYRYPLRPLRVGAPALLRLAVGPVAAPLRAWCLRPGGSDFEALFRWCLPTRDAATALPQYRIEYDVAVRSYAKCCEIDRLKSQGAGRAVPLWDSWPTLTT